MKHLGENAPLWARWKGDRDEAAREQLIEQYRYLVRLTATRVTPTAPQSVEREELYAAGAIGLIKAVERFDPQAGTRFETFAITYIRGAVLEHMREEDHVPRSVRSRIKTMESAILHLEEETKARPTPEAVAALLGWTLDQVLDTLDARLRAIPIPLSTPNKSHNVVDGGLTRDGYPLEGALKAKGPSPFAQALKAQQRAVLLGALDRLPDRERTALTLYHYDGLMCREVGARLGVSENRAYQLIQKGTRRMQQLIGHLASLFESEEPEVAHR